MVATLYYNVNKSEIWFTPANGLPSIRMTIEKTGENIVLVCSAKTPSTLTSIPAYTFDQNIPSLFPSYAGDFSPFVGHVWPVTHDGDKLIITTHSTDFRDSDVEYAATTLGVYVSKLEFTKWQTEHPFHWRDASCLYV